MKTVGATEFKTHCLQLLDEVASGREEIVVLKRGKPVARILPFVAEGQAPQAGLAGSMVAADDLLEPPLPSEAWEVEAPR